MYMCIVYVYVCVYIHIYIYIYTKLQQHTRHTRRNVASDRRGSALVVRARGCRLGAARPKQIPSFRQTLPS